MPEHRTVTPVILSGGSGTRLWPLSRSLLPKQLQPLTSERTMIQATAERFDNSRPGPTFSAPIIVCAHAHRFVIAEQLRAVNLDPKHEILEPVGRNTAPAVAAAALLAGSTCPDTVLIVLPADHEIRKLNAFLEAVTHGAEAAACGRLVTFGVVASKPETGYGYVRVGAELGDGPTRELIEFVEKPDRATAERYVSSADYLWNSGIFMFTAKRFLEELRISRPDILEAVEIASKRGLHDPDFFRLDRKAFEECPSESIDYAVMEKTAHGAVIPVDIGWSDVGSWSALWELGNKDTDGNVTVGDVITSDTTGCYVRSEKRLVATLGIDSTIVVDTGDVVMVASMERDQDVKKLVAHIKQAERTEHESPQRVFQSWGWSETIDSGVRHQLSFLLIKPGHKLSPQPHHCRAKHWLVIEGSAEVSNGAEKTRLGEDESIFIPVETKHELANPGDVDAKVIEVRLGSGLSAADTVRYKDGDGCSEVQDKDAIVTTSRRSCKSGSSLGSQRMKSRPQIQQHLTDPASLEEWNRAPYPLRMHGNVQHYPWGSRDAIAQLLGKSNPDGKPFAELWLGAHPQLPAYVTLGSGEISMQRLMETSGPRLLGETAFERFEGAFPFLMKILSAAKPLSIQAHPSREQARAGFARENLAGLEVDDPQRNYKDDKPKPELISALEDFYALRGFRPLEEIERTLRDTPELIDLVADRTLTDAAMVALYVKLMQLPQPEVNRRLTALTGRLRSANKTRPFGKADREYWAIRADDEFSRRDEKDRGLFSVFLLNLVCLHPGQAMYLPAGEPHAYLEGTGVEIMANSNNVLRGGLTPKRVDVKELLSVLTFKCRLPTLLELETVRASTARERYVTPSVEFELSRVQLAPGESDVAGTSSGVEIGIVIEGKASVTSQHRSNLELERGQAFLIPCGTRYALSTSEATTVFVGSVPSPRVASTPTAVCFP